MGPDFGALGERTAPALRGETAAQALQRFFWLCFAKWLALQQLALQVAPLAARPHGEGVLLEVGVSWGLFAVPPLNTAEQLLGLQLGAEPVLPMRGSVWECWEIFGCSCQGKGVTMLRSFLKIWRCEIVWAATRWASSGVASSRAASSRGGFCSIIL